MSNVLHWSPSESHPKLKINVSFTRTSGESLLHVLHCVSVKLSNTRMHDDVNALITYTFIARIVWYIVSIDRWTNIAIISDVIQFELCCYFLHRRCCLSLSHSNVPYWDEFIFDNSNLHYITSISKMSIRTYRKKREEKKTKVQKWWKLE